MGLDCVVVFVPPWTHSCPALHSNTSPTLHPTKGSACRAMLRAAVLVCQALVLSLPTLPPGLPEKCCAPAANPYTHTLAIPWRCHTHHHSQQPWYQQPGSLPPRMPVLSSSAPVVKAPGPLPSLPPPIAAGHVAKCLRRRRPKSRPARLATLTTYIPRHSPHT